MSYSSEARRHAGTTQEEKHSSEGNEPVSSDVRQMRTGECRVTVPKEHEGTHGPGFQLDPHYRTVSRSHAVSYVQNKPWHIG